MNVSKELLSEVLGEQVNEIQILKNKAIFGGIQLWISSESHDVAVNIYELQHKCKEWAYTQGYIIITWNENPHFFDSEWQSEIFKIGEITANKRQRLNFFYGLSTEPEAIFKACQWILDNKDKQ